MMPRLNMTDLRAVPVGITVRALVLGLAIGWPVVGAAQSLPAQATQQGRHGSDQVGIDRLMSTIQLEQMLNVMIEEELGFGEDLRADMLPEVTSARWSRELRAGLSLSVLKPMFVAAFSQALSGADTRNAHLTAEIAALGADPVMAKAIDLEVKARRLLLDPDVEAAAFEQAAKSEKTKRYKDLANYIEALDLVEINVAGSLNSNLVFYREMVRGGAFPYEVTEQEMLGDVAAEADSMRQEIGEWLTAYLYMAYAPMSDVEFARFSKLGLSAAGRAFYHASDRGYDAVFAHNSKVMGAMVAGHLAGEAL